MTSRPGTDEAEFCSSRSSGKRVRQSAPGVLIEITLGHRARDDGSKAAGLPSRTASWSEAVLSSACDYDGSSADDADLDGSVPPDAPRISRSASQGDHHLRIAGRDPQLMMGGSFRSPKPFDYGWCIGSSPASPARLKSELKIENRKSAPRHREIDLSDFSIFNFQFSISDQRYTHPMLTHGSDRARQAGDRVILQSAIAKGWTPRTPKTLPNAEFPGTACCGRAVLRWVRDAAAIGPRAYVLDAVARRSPIRRSRVMTRIRGARIGSRTGARSGGSGCGRGSAASSRSCLRGADSSRNELGVGARA